MGGVDPRYLLHFPTHLIAAINVAILSAVAAAPLSDYLTLAVWTGLHFATLVISAGVLYASQLIANRSHASRIGVMAVVSIGGAVGLVKGVSTAIAAAFVFGQPLLVAETSVR